MFLLRALILILVFSPLTSFGQAGNGKLQVHHIDMGQGDSAILISPGGETVLFDAGGDMAKVKTCASIVDYLDQLGITEIDYIFVSHYHFDHIGCIPQVLSRFPLKHDSYDRGASYKSAEYRKYVVAVGAHRKTAQLGHAVTLDAGSGHQVDIAIEAFNGTYKGGSVEAKDENDVSLSALISFGAFREEIGGDLSGEKTGKYVDVETGTAPSVGELDVYKVHHHCSSHSSNDNWLEATKPTVAVISVGDKNGYGHPTSDCLQRLHDGNISKVYWTEEGAGQKPGPNDVVSGDVVVEVPTGATAYTISHNGGTVEAYPIKAGPPAAGQGGNNGGAGTLFAWSARSKFYYPIDCPAVSRISKANLQTGTQPPANKTLRTCDVHTD